MSINSMTCSTLPGTTGRRRRTPGWDPLADALQLFARNLRFWLEQRKKSGAWLAKQVGVSAATVSHWTTGKHGPDVAKVGRIAEVLEIAVQELFTEFGTSANVPRPDVAEFDPELAKAFVDFGKRFGLNVKFQRKSPGGPSRKKRVKKKPE
jgi:transcriptional regulator with XRE-family HTH domain